MLTVYPVLHHMHGLHQTKSREQVRMNSGAHVLKLISECFFFFSLVYWLDKWKQNFLLVKKTECKCQQSATSTVTVSARVTLVVFSDLLLCFVFCCCAICFVVVFCVLSSYVISCCVLHFRATIHMSLW